MTPSNGDPRERSNCCVTFADPHNPSILEREVALAGNNCCVKFGAKRSKDEKKTICLALLGIVFVMGFFVTMIMLVLVKRDAQNWAARNKGN